MKSSICYFAKVWWQKEYPPQNGSWVTFSPDDGYDGYPYPRPLKIEFKSKKKLIAA